MSIARRSLLQGATAAVASLGAPTGTGARSRARVVVASAGTRGTATAACLEALDLRAIDGQDVAVKANFNSADAFPASTHPETLGALLAGLKERRAISLTLGERSGMGDTRRVLHAAGAADVVKAAGGRLVVLDDVGREGWRRFAGEHWPQGFLAARLFADAAFAVQTMCCKTHRFGGQVTLSLKNTVGLVAKQMPGEEHDYMRDLHGSRHQRAMIAEANVAWRPALSLMDCAEAFIDGGPEQGTRARPGVFLASEDRCALDAAAIALLRLHGMRGPAGTGPIGQTEQLARAIELGLGAGPAAVDVVAVDAGARDVARRLAELLAAG